MYHQLSLPSIHDLSPISVVVSSCSLNRMCLIITHYAILVIWSCPCLCLSPHIAFTSSCFGLMPPPFARHAIPFDLKAHSLLHDHPDACRPRSYSNTHLYWTAYAPLMLVLSMPVASSELFFVFVYPLFCFVGFLLPHTVALRSLPCPRRLLLCSSAKKTPSACVNINPYCFPVPPSPPSWFSLGPIYSCLRFPRRLRPAPCPGYGTDTHVLYLAQGATSHLFI